MSVPAVTYLRSYRAPFGAPTRMAVDASGNVYVTDPGLGQVIVRAPNGRILSRGDGLGRPVSVAVGSAGTVYVGDADSGSVTAFDSNWQPVRQLGKGAGEFLQPNDVTVDAATGNLYVADSAAHLIKVYSASGAFLQSFGGQGSGDGQFNFPAGVVVDAAARQILVADQLNYRIQVFDVAGTFLSCFGAQGSEPGHFNMPQGVAIDGHGRVYVADSVEGRVHVLDRSGNGVGYIGDFGEAPGQLRIPMAMVIDPSNRLFVSAANNARLEVFGLDAFADPETIAPAVVHVEPNPIERANPAPVVVGYLEVPGHPLDQIVPGSITANGVATTAAPFIVGDYDGDGVPDARVEFDRTALLATLPVDGTGTVAVSGTIGRMHFEGSATVRITTCGPETVCTLGNADPQCNEAVCIAPVGCTIRPKADGSGCEDGNACTVGDACRGGVCVGAPLSCDDRNGCTDDSCDPVAGCVHVNNTAPCDDGNACTAGDACAGGVCSGTPLACDDGNACTDDSCNPASGCVHVNNTAPCDDGNACTAGDACAGGVCSGTPLVCDDGNACTDDSCDPVSGCVYANNTAPCDDGNACTVRDTCAGGVCRGRPRPCDDGNACTDDSCNPASGCVHTYNTAPCDDRDPGTVRDACNGAGKCTGQAVTGNYALLAWPLSTPGHRTASLSTHALVRGDVCAESIAAGAASQIEGDAVAWASGGSAITLSSGSQIAGNAVTEGGRLVGLGAAAVGGRIEQSGVAAELTECFAARYRAGSRRAEFAARVPSAGLALGAIELEDGGDRRIPSTGSLGAGQSLIDATVLQLGSSSTVTLVASPSTEAVIVRVRGKMMIGPGAQIVTQGVPAERVIFVIDGPAILYRNARVTGSVFAAGRVQTGLGSTVTGALLGSAIDLAPYTTVDLRSFVGW